MVHAKGGWNGACFWGFVGKAGWVGDRASGKKRCVFGGDKGGWLLDVNGRLST